MGLSLLHVTPYYEEAWAYGGIPRLAASLCRALARRGHRVTVCTTDARDATARLGGSFTERLRPWPPFLGAGGDVVVRVFPNLSNRLAYDLQFFTPIGFHGFLRREVGAFDVAHIHAHRNVPSVLAAGACRHAGVPYVVQPNGTAGMIERRQAAKWLFDATVGGGVLPGAARVIAVTDVERRQLAAAGVSGSRVRVVPNPVEVADFAAPPDGWAFRRRFGIGFAEVILYLGKLTPRKRVDVLIRAVAALRDGRGHGSVAPRIGPTATGLVIAGNDMGEGPRLQRLAADLGLADVVHFTGLLRAEERAAALAAAVVVVYAGEDEIFGLVPLEALLCGTPVIVGSDSGCGEIMAAIPGAASVPPGDEAALAAAIGEVLAAPARWREQARGAGDTIRRRYDPDVVAAQLEAVYDEVARPT